MLQGNQFGPEIMTDSKEHKKQDLQKLPTGRRCVEGSKNDLTDEPLEGTRGEVCAF